MQALATARAPTFQQRMVRSQTKTAKRNQRRQTKTRQQNLPSEAFATFRYSAHSVPKAMNFFIKAWKKRHEQAYRLYKESKSRVSTNIIRRGSRSMSFKSNVHFLGFF
jgi:hypothetical protein